MEIGKYLLNKQPFVSKSFSFALHNDKLAHAYLLSGESGTPLKQTAIYLAKSILCDHPDPLADLECNTCRRIELGEYPDFVFIDGEESSIKKDDVSTLVSLFQQTPLESKGIMVYVIHLVENMTIEAANGLLKFLEEPTSYSYAILTTQNEEKVLPTIQSRCEKLRLLLTSREEVLEEAKEQGVKLEDAEVLSFFYNDGSLIKEVAESEDYLVMKEALLSELGALASNASLARYTMEKEVVPLLNSKQKARFFFDLLVLFLKDCLASKSGNTPSLSSYAKIIGEVADKLPHIEQSLLDVMTLRREIELNINIALLLSHLSALLTTKE